MGGALKLAEKPIEFRDTESPAKGMEGLGFSIGPEPFALSLSDWKSEAVGPSTFKDGPNLPLFGDTDMVPAGAVNYFTDFSQVVRRLTDTTSEATPAELYHAVEEGALRFLERSVPNFGNIGGLVKAGLDIFAALRIPGSVRLEGSTLQPKHVKIAEEGAGLKIEDVGGKSASDVWVGEKIEGTERFAWKRLQPGVAYRPKSDGLLQVAVGPLALDAKGEPKDFNGVEHFGVNGVVGERRIFRME